MVLGVVSSGKLDAREPRAVLQDILVAILAADAVAQPIIATLWTEYLDAARTVAPVLSQAARAQVQFRIRIQIP